MSEPRPSPARRRRVSPRQRHLEKYRSGFLWRRRWPLVFLDLNFIHGAFLSFSLRTHLPADAKILARRLTALSDPVFAALVENEMPIAPDVIETVLTELFRFEIAAFEEVRRHAPTRSREAAEADQRREALIQDTLRHALFLRDREAARAPLRRIATHLGIEISEDDPDWRGLAVDATRVLLEVSEERQRRDRGVFPNPTRFFRSAMHMVDAPSKATKATTVPEDPAWVSPVDMPLPNDAFASNAPGSMSATPHSTPPVTRRDTVETPVHVGSITAHAAETAHAGHEKGKPDNQSDERCHLEHEDQG